MPKKHKRRVEEFSTDELRQMLIEKRRAERSARLENYRRTGRSIKLEPASQINPFEETPNKFSEQEEQTWSKPSKKRSFFDRLLVGIEILAVLGLVFLLFNGFNLVRNLNQEVSASLVQPTLTPTAIFQPVVLPGGHTPPIGPEGGQPNESEIPQHLRAHVQSMARIPTPTSSPNHAIRIQIPAISVDAPVVMGDGDEQLKKGVGQYVASVNPGQNGNIVLSAHNDIFGEIFRDLDKLKTGDEIIIFTANQSYTYIVQEQQVVEPTQVEVMAPTTDPVATLISCYPYMVDNKRIVIRAILRTQ